jgi:hypothetical protein
MCKGCDYAENPTLFDDAANDSRPERLVGIVPEILFQAACRSLDNLRDELASQISRVLATRPNPPTDISVASNYAAAIVKLALRLIKPYSADGSDEQLAVNIWVPFKSNDVGALVRRTVKKFPMDDLNALYDCSPAQYARLSDWCKHVKVDDYLE